MESSEAKAVLHRYLQSARDAVVWKLEGASEYDVRRPMTPTGTNLLGLVKHLAAVEAGYFGFVFDRPYPEPMPWDDEDAEANADMWATAEESRADLLALYRRVWTHADTTISELPLEATGTVPWWSGERRTPTLHTVLVHVVAETNRHAGHLDIVRELVDGAAGLRSDVTGLPAGDQAWWARYRNRLEEVAQSFRDV
jgi:uncharacterized damage-inducible protein DinB